MGKVEVYDKHGKWIRPWGKLKVCMADILTPSTKEFGWPLHLFEIILLLYRVQISPLSHNIVCVLSNSHHWFLMELPMVLG